MKYSPQEWLNIHNAVSEELLGIQGADACAGKLVQPMFLPRRACTDAVYKQYLVVGRAMGELDIQPHANRLKSMSVTRQRALRHATMRKAHPNRARNYNGGSCRGYTLRDGLNARALHRDHGHRINLPLLFRELGWPIRDERAGNGITIKCPNHPEHSDPDVGSDTACWCSPADETNKALIMCHHNHCRDLRTWEFFPLIEDRIFDGEASLPTRFSSLTEMLCSKELYNE